MGAVIYLSTKQQQVLDDLFEGKLSEEEVLEKRKVRHRTYCKWHTMENFAAEYKRRLKAAVRGGELIIALYAGAAASKLTNLMVCEKQETARKACLDVINHFNRKRKKGGAGKEQAEAEEELPELSSELASNLLKVIADDRRQRSKKAETTKAQ